MRKIYTNWRLKKKKRYKWRPQNWLKAEMNSRNKQAKIKNAETPTLQVSAMVPS